MKRTFVDTGVLIAAVRGEDAVAVRAMEILDDADREFASSVFVELEVLPKPIYFRKQDEARFYKEFFNAVTYWPDSVECLVQEANRQACHWGLSAMDALHVAAAVLLGAEELVTSEGPEKAIHRAKCVRVISIKPRSAA